MGERVRPGDVATLPAAVFRQAAERPTATAVDGPDGRTDYATLARTVTGLAGRLRAAGVRHGDLVVLHGRWSADTIAAALAVMRVGAAVVPVDSGDPPARAELVLRESAARVVLSAAAARLPDGNWTVLPLPGPPTGSDPARAGDPGRCGQREAGAPDDGSPADPVRPDDLAYVLFTSGSTGRPKGVMIEHRSLTNYLRHVADTYPVDGAVPPLPALTPMSFDASVLQVYAPLARGAAVWLPPDGVREDPAALARLLAERPGCGLHCVPALWEEVLRELAGWPAGTPLPRLAALLLGGEVVRPDLWRRTRELLPGTRLADVYGPTETTVQVTGGFQEPGEPLTAGQPFADARIVVLDRAGRPVPTGTPGEIHIGGVPVGRGYLGRPGLTAERFVPDPWAPGGRLYRSGDEGFLDPEGRLVVLGRLDDQVKVRGFRIEPGEVEAALCGLPGVRSAAVAVQAAGTSAARLVAAVVVAAGADPEQLPGRLAEVLPAHLVPTLIRGVDALPRQANGKLDRAAVAGLVAAAPDSGPVPGGRAASGDHRPDRAGGSGGDPTAGVGPDGDLTGRLRSIWAEILGVARVADDDDFFAIGGHSLLATRLVGRLRREFGRPVPLRAIFDNRTFAGFAGAIGRLLGAGADDQGSRAPVRVPPGRDVPLSLEQRPLWAVERVAPGMTGAHVLLPLRLTGRLDAGAVSAALDVLIRRHEALRTVVAEGTAGPVQRVLPATGMPLTTYDLGELPDREQWDRARSVALRAYRTPFRLDAEPPVRAIWLRLADDRSILLLCLHHLCCDGVSLRILTTELADALRADRPPAPVAGLTYRDYAAWQQDRWRAGEFRRELAERIGQLPAGPVGWPGPPPPAERRTHRYASRSRRIGGELAAGLSSVATAYGTTPFVVVSAALAAAARGRGATGELVVGILAANRLRAEFEATVGLFATTLVVPVPVPPAGGSFAATLAVTRERALRAQAHQELPLDVVVEEARRRATAVDQPFAVGLVVDWRDDLPVADPAGDGPSVSLIELDTEEIPLGVMAAASPLTVYVTRGADSLRLAAEYSEDVLTAEEVDDLLSGLAAVLRRAAVDPAAAVDLPPAERSAVG